MTDAPASWRGGVSVVVPTHDRPASLVRLLRVLGRPGATLPDEAIVVADGCTPATLRAVAAEVLPYPLRVVEQQPARGAAAARNAGAALATGDVLLFLDDDIEPFGDVVEEHRRLHDGRARVVIGAPRAPLPRDAGFRELAGWAWWEQQFERMRRPGHRFGYDDVFTGLLSLPRTLWASLGGFDASLRCREDYELGLRLLRCRGDFVFSETGGGWHHENRSGERLVMRKREEGSADVAIARLHPWAFRALPLGRGAPEPRASLVRRAAFEWPRLGDLATRIAERLLDVLETLRLRSAWRTLQGGVMYYAYWRGAATALAGWSELATLRTRGLVEQPPEFREEVLDLGEDLEAAARRIDDSRPDVLRLRVGDVPLGTTPVLPGREPWRRVHLASPPDDLIAAAAAARAIAELRDAGVRA